MKNFYSKDAPKSRQRKNPPSGVCFGFSWDKIARIVHEYRLEHGLTETQEYIEAVFVDDHGVTFYTELLNNYTRSKK